MIQISYEDAIIKIQNICKKYNIPTRLLDTDIFPQGTETDDIQDVVTLNVKYKPAHGSYDALVLSFYGRARYMDLFEYEDLVTIADKYARLAKCVSALTEEFKNVEIKYRE